MIYDFLATIGLVVCVTVGIALVMAIAAHVWAGITALRRKREIRRYPVRAYVDLQAEAASAECGYFDLRDHVLNVKRLREVDHDRAA